MKSPFWVALLIATLASVNSVHANWPERPLVSIGPLAAGGGADIALRALATFAKDRLGQPILVTNKPGGGSTAAAMELLSKPADGYTFVALLSPGFAPEVYRHFYDVPYKSTDLVPVARMITFPFGILVHGSSPWKTLADFTKDAKENPGKYSYGHTGRGIQLHLTPAAYIMKESLKLREVPTKGASEVLQILLGKHIDAGMSSTAAARKYMESGDLRMLALQNATREPSFPNVPTFKELGYDFGMPAPSMSIYMKAGTPPEIVTKLHDIIKATMEDPKFLELARKAEVTLSYAPPEGVMKDIEGERTHVAPLLKQLGMFKE